MDKYLQRKVSDKPLTATGTITGDRPSLQSDDEGVKLNKTMFIDEVDEHSDSDDDASSRKYLRKSIVDTLTVNMTTTI